MPELLSVIDHVPQLLLCRFEIGTERIDLDLRPDEFEAGFERFDALVTILDSFEFDSDILDLCLELIDAGKGAKELFGSGRDGRAQDREFFAGPTASQSVSSSNRNLRNIYGPQISAAAEVYAVDENMSRAVIWQESRFKDRAIPRAGAKGLMQLMPGIARDLQVIDVNDPIQNVAGEARYLQTLLQHYNGNPELELAAYNAGREAIRRYQGIPPYRETRQYIEAIRLRLAAAVVQQKRSM